MATPASAIPRALVGQPSGKANAKPSAATASPNAAINLPHEAQKPIGWVAAAPSDLSFVLIGSGLKPALRIASSATRRACSSAAMANSRSPKLNCKPRMPATPSSARRISDSSDAQSMFAIRNRCGSTAVALDAIGPPTAGDVAQPLPQPQAVSTCWRW